MGQKANPISLRLNINRNFDSCWFQDMHYSKLLTKEIQLRKYLSALFASINIHQGRLVFQFFPKKIIVHFFFTDFKQGSTQSKSNKLNTQRKPQRISYSETKSKKFLEMKKKPEIAGDFVKQTSLPFTLFSSNFLPQNTFLAAEHKNNSLWQQDLNEGVLLQLPYKQSEIPYKQSERVELEKSRLRAIKGKILFLFMKHILYLKSSFQSSKERQEFSSMNLPFLLSLNLFNYLLKTNHLSGSANLETEGKTFLTQRSNGEKNESFGQSWQSKKELPIISQTIAKNWQNFSNQSQITSYFFSIKLPSKYQSAHFICDYIAKSFEGKIAFKEIYKQIQREILRDSNLLGFRIQCSGRIGGVEMAKVESRKYGQTSLHTFSGKVDFALAEAYTSYGIIGIKVWLCSSV